MGDTATRPTLLQIATSSFSKVSLAEEKLLEAALTGEDADCTNASGKDRIIRAKLFSWLCTNPDASAQVTYRGISIIGADIQGEVDLQWARIPFSIRAIKCVFSHPILLSRGHFIFLSLVGSSVKDLKANTAWFETDVLLRNDFKAEGTVDFISATLGGNLDCDGGRFIAKDKALAINANGANIRGSVFLRNGFRAEGGVDLGAARIDGFLRCDGGEFFSKGKQPALNANGITIQRGVFLRKDYLTGKIFKAEGGVDLRVATIGLRLECDGGEFIGTDDRPALNASSCEYCRTHFLA